MKDWLFGGILGLLLGWTLQRCGLPRPCDVQRFLSLRQPRQTRTLITALGFTIVLAAGMGWLAVLDVDHFRVLPLHGGTILGALLMALVIVLDSTASSPSDLNRLSRRSDPNRTIRSS